MTMSRLHAADAVYCRVDYPMDGQAGCAGVAAMAHRLDMRGMTKEFRRL